jgi:hypothetical protein
MEDTAHGKRMEGTWEAHGSLGIDAGIFKYVNRGGGQQSLSRTCLPPSLGGRSRCSIVVISVRIATLLIAIRQN